MLFRSTAFTLASATKKTSFTAITLSNHLLAPNHKANHTVNMRFAAIIFAGLAAAAPQASVVPQPISQISDGQIQAPPATSAAVPAPEVPSYSATVIASVPVESAPPVVAPSAPVATATPVAPVPTLVTPIVPGVNSTGALSTGATPAASTSGAAGSATTSSTIPEQSQAAAAGNAISFGGLVVAMAAAVLA